MAEHAWNEGHRVDWEGMKILKSVLEEKGLRSHLIKKSSRNSNLDCSLALSQTWFPYFE